MAVPSLITDLSATIASNSPAGSDFIGGNLDDYLRAFAGILRQESLNKSWIAYGDAPTYATVATFTVASDKTTTYTPGRPIKAVVTAGTAYGVVIKSAFAASTTTVTVITDIGLDAGLSRVDVGGEKRSIQETVNQVINPWFRFWQRNTSFTTAASTYTNTADGWACHPGTGGGIVTFSRSTHTFGQTTVPFEPVFYMTWAQSTGGTSPFLAQRMESVRTYAGQTVTFWFMADVTSGTQSVTPSVTQYFGSGGSPSANVTTSGAAITLSTTTKLFSCTIAVPSISGKSFGTDSNTSCLRINLTFPSATTFTANFYCFGVTPGSFAVVEPPRTEMVELLNCQRRIFKTFQHDVTPSQNSAIRVGAVAYTAVQAGVNSYCCLFPLPTPLRSQEAAAATLTTYSVAAASSAWYNATGGAVSGAAAMAVVGGATLYPKNYVAITNAQAAGDAVGNVNVLHFMVDCEFPVASI